MKTSNIFKNIPKHINEEIFEDIFLNDNIKIERIISKGDVTSDREWYDQDNNEWVIVMKGEAVLSFENQEDIRLKSGDYINIPAHTKHRVSWTIETQETIWLAIHY